MTAEFKRTILTSATLAEARRLITDYEVMLVTVLDAIVDRHERDPDYPFVDTKLDLMTGRDFATPADDAKDFKGKTAIYGWIQGRGLEALAGHARWLAGCSVLTPPEREARIARVRRMIERVFDQMEMIRSRNLGRLFFLMTPEGMPFDRDESGCRRLVYDLPSRPHNMSDLFYVKGMLAAAVYLGRAEKVEEAKRSFRDILQQIETERFRSDGISFDPKNVARAEPGKFSHGPRMIAIGACALFAELLGEDEWFKAGRRLIRHILDRHANHGQCPKLTLHDFWEGSAADGTAWVTDGEIVSDPGHATEFVGLAARLLLLPKEGSQPSANERELIERCRKVLPGILRQNFVNGYNPQVGGICKTFDLASREPINSDMPWWNLPETMRAAAELMLLGPAEERPAMLEILAACSNGFMKSFVNPEIHLMARQTVASDGRAVSVIPATADADPGYHTGLSIIDVLACLRSAHTD